MSMRVCGNDDVASTLLCFIHLNKAVWAYMARDEKRHLHWQLILTDNDGINVAGADH